MVDTSAAEFAAETPYFYSTYAAAGSPPEAPPVDAPGVGRHRLRAGAHRPGHRVRLLRRPGRRCAAPPGPIGGDDQLQPGDGVDRLRRVDAAVLRVARRRERPRGLPRRVRRRRGRPTRSSSSAARRRSASPTRWPRPASRSAAWTRTRSTRPRSGCASPGSSSGWASRSPRAAWPRRSRRRWSWRRRWATRSSSGRRSSSVAWPSTSPTGRSDLERIIARAVAVDDERPVRIDAYLEGLELDVDAITDGTDVLIPGLIEHVERAGVHSGDSIGVYPPQRISDGRPAAGRRRHHAHRAGGRRTRPDQRPVHRARRRRLPARGQSRAPRVPCRSCPR